MRGLSIAPFVFCLFFGSLAGDPTATAQGIAETSCRPVTGFYHAERTWTQESPVLVVREGRDEHLLRGEIVEVGEGGIVFDPKRTSPFFNPKAKLFPYGEVVVAVDDQGKTVYGSMPDAYSSVVYASLVVRPAGQEATETQRINLHPAEAFEACLAPGPYEVVDILLSRSPVAHGFIESLDSEPVFQVLDLPEMQFVVDAERDTYLGDLHLFENIERAPDEALMMPFHVKPRALDRVGIRTTPGGANVSLSLGKRRPHVLGTMALTIEAAPDAPSQKPALHLVREHR